MRAVGEARPLVVRDGWTLSGMLDTQRTVVRWRGAFMGCVEPSAQMPGQWVAASQMDGGLFAVGPSHSEMLHCLLRHGASYDADSLHAEWLLAGGDFTQGGGSL